MDQREDKIKLQKDECKMSLIKAWDRGEIFSFLESCGFEVEGNISRILEDKGEDMTKQPGGFMSDKPATTAQFINKVREMSKTKVVASNDIIKEQQKQIEQLKSQIQYINAVLELDDNEG